MSGHSFAQENTPAPPPPLHQKVAPKDSAGFKERVFFGGNVGAWFGPTTYLNLSPLVGYKINKELSVGVGFTYNYFSQTYLGQKYVATIYGSNTFARYFYF